jgi:Ca2+-binding RTX toxin-like protein
MATIAYTNSLVLNPSLDIILDSSGTIGTHDATTFEIINAVSGSVAENFVFRITGAGFTYTGTTPTGGTISGVTVFDGASNTVATITGAFGNTSLATFWTNLQSSGHQLAALDNFLSTSDTMNGSDNADRLTTYGNVAGNFDTLFGGAGNDILRQRGTVNDNILVGGTGDDVFRIDQTGLPSSTMLAVHGSALDGTGGAGETDVLEIRGQFIRFSSITNIDGLRFAQLTPVPLTDIGRSVTFTPEQIAVGQVSPTLAVEGFGGTGGDLLRVTQTGSTPLNLDLSGWSFTFWGAPNQVVEIAMNGHVIGTPVADTILLGGGDDTADGGMGNDTVSAGLGNDTLNGNQGDDTLNGEVGNDSLDGGPGNDNLVGGDDNDQLFSKLGEGPSAGGTETLDGGAGTDFGLVDRSDQTRSFNLDLGDPTIATSIGDGTSIIRVERIEFRAGSGNDHLTGGALADILIGNGGSDFLAGGGGDDDLQGGNGIDTLSGDAGNDALAGGGGNDNLDGGDGDDTLTGGLGIDTLDGGDGVDTAVFSGARSGYTITPFGSTFQISGPDGLDFLANVEFAKFDDVTIALTSGGPSNQPPSITSNGGGASASVTVGENTTAVTTVTATDPDAGTTLVYSISGGADQTKFQINSATGALSFLAAPNFEVPTDSDHNNSYVVQVRASDGSLFDDQVISVNVSDLNESAVRNDFNADSLGDILWQTDNGTLAIWEMNGIQISLADYTRLGQSAVGQPGTDWHIVDIVDFDRDSKADILWRTDSGALALWKMDGTHVKSADFLRLGTAPIGTPGSDWHALGASDFDGDGKSDILWRTDSGALAIWAMDGNQIKSADYLRSGSTAVGVPASDWKIVGVGDFDADGRGDLLWETGSGALAVWKLDGAQIKSADYVKLGTSNVGTPGSDWHVADVADFDGDGRSDILWRIGPAVPASGFPPGGGGVAIWEMNGNQIKAADFTRVGSTIVGAPGSDWHLLGADDHNGDGKADLLWRTDAGVLAVWEMDGTHVSAADYTRLGSTNVGAPGSDWHVFQHHYDLV